MNSKQQIFFSFYGILANSAISLGVAILLTSCSANTYNFLSINDPFIDTTRSIKVRAIAGITSKELQVTSRVYGNLVVGASVFANYWDIVGKSARLSGEGLIAYNIPLLRGTDWQLSVGGGYSESEIEQIDKTFLMSYIYQVSRANYNTRFWQIGLNCPIDKNTSVKFF
jgi:hypothetical protein